MCLGPVSVTPPVLCGLCGRAAGRHDPIDVRPRFYDEVVGHLPEVIEKITNDTFMARCRSAPVVRRMNTDRILAFQRKSGPWQTLHQVGDPCRFCSRLFPDN